MKIIALTKHNPKHLTNILDWPEEDSFKYEIQKNKIALTIADGITRDPIGMPHLPDKNTLVGEVELAVEYPIPSPARKAADTFCESFIRKSKPLKPSIKSIRESIKFSNDQIRKLNKKNNPSPDYLEKDYWACLGATGFIKDNYLFYGYVCDCGVCVFNSAGKLKFITKDEGPTTLDKGIWSSPQLKGKNWSDPEARKIQRSQFRNNPKEKYSYGAFTGEKEAMKFVRTGKIKLAKESYIVFFTDGLKPIISSSKFNIKKQFEKLEKYVESNSAKIGGSEGTLVAIKLD